MNTFIFALLVTYWKLMHMYGTTYVLQNPSLFDYLLGYLGWDLE